MRKILVLAAALAAAIAFACPAVAQTLSNYTLIDSAQHNFKVAVYQNPTTTFIAPASVSADSAGNPLSGTIGISNPNGTALYVQGVTNGVPVLTSFSAPQHVICDSGCGGGGGGGGAVFGPTAVGTANANPPVMIGGTADGTATGVVGILKVLGGSAFINCANCSGSGISVAFGGAIGSVGTPGGFKDGSGNFQPFLGDVTNGEWVNIKASVAIPVTGTFFQATQPISGTVSLSGTSPISGTVTANAGTNLNTSLLALEGGGNLASINTKTPALGQALAASSVPVVLTALQLSALTPPAALTNFALETGGNLTTIVTNTGRIPAQGQALAAASLPVVLTALQITALTPPTTVTVQQPTGTNLHIVCDSGCSGSGGTSSTFGAAFPAAGTAIGMSQGGNMVALNGTAGNLLVSCANCSGSGASAVDEATITFGTSVFAPMGGAYQTTATSNPLVSGQQGMAQLTINRAVHMNLRNSTGVEVGVAATPLQVSLANTGANGTALAVTLASTTVTGTVAVTQSTSPWIVAGGGTAGTPGTAVLTIQGIASGTNVPTSHASGSVASGAYASGSIASGAYASGAIGAGAVAAGAYVSGSVLSGAYAAGSIVDLAAVLSPLNSAAATATKGLVTAGQFLSTQPTMTNTLQGALLLSSRGELLVAPGVTGFAVTMTSTTITGTVAVTQASASIASGAYAAGSIGAGAVAAGAYVSGSILSGALASGAVVDITNMSATIAGGVPAKAMYAGMNVAGNITGIVGKAASTASTAADVSLVTNESPNSQLSVATGTTADAPCTAPATSTACSIDSLLKALLNTGQYPAGAVAITASATGTTGATTATLAAAVGKTTYICTYSIRANATSATNVTNTITGVITATMSSGMWIAPAASGIGIDEQVYPLCVPASATNTAINIVSGAPGAGGFVTVKATGYQL